MIDDVYRVSDNVRKLLAMSGKELSDEVVLEKIEDYILSEACYAYNPFCENRKLIDAVFNTLRKDLGIIEPYLEDDNVSEIMVNGKGKVFAEYKDGVKLVPEKFYSTEELEEMIRRIAGKVRKEFNELNPILDARLSDGSRVNAVYKNIAIGGPALTIRKFPDEAIDMEKLISYGTISREAADYLKDLVFAGYNIFISGGTSSGKTTFLNCLTEFIPERERIVVIEDSLEIQIKGHSNVVRLECKAANSQGIGEVTMTDLIKTSLRMRPERIIVGEVRGKEVADMINANNTGHDGSISTGHGNSVSGMIKRLESMFLQATDFPMAAIRAQITEGIDIFVHLQRMPDRSRKVVEITEICGFKGDEYILNPLFEYVPDKGLIPTGNNIKDDFKFRIRGRYEN